MRRLREAMIKCIILNGIPVFMEAFQSLASMEQPEDQDHSFTKVRPNPSPNQEHQRRPDSNGLYEEADGSLTRRTTAEAWRSYCRRAPQKRQRKIWATIVSAHTRISVSTIHSTRDLP